LYVDFASDVNRPARRANGVFPLNQAGRATNDERKGRKDRKEMFGSVPYAVLRGLCVLGTVSADRH
jgi:hypothetical protein